MTLGSWIKGSWVLDYGWLCRNRSWIMGVILGKGRRSLGVVTELGRSAFDRGGVIAGLVVHLMVGRSY